MERAFFFSPRLAFDTDPLAEPIEEPVDIGVEFFASRGTRNSVERNRLSKHPRQHAIWAQQPLRVNLAVGGFIGGAWQHLAQSAIDSRIIRRQAQTQTEFSFTPLRIGES